jgi:ubiquinone/menaquinone biosynthesis C-methylase UbiE
MNYADPRIAYFDRLAPVWDSRGPDPEVAGRRLPLLRDQLDFRPGEALLEVGCGTGQITGWLADQVRPGRVLAIDFSSGMLARARDRGMDAEFRQLDICAAAPGESEFDVALCFHAFPHFREPIVALRHLAAALKPGGRLIILHLIGSGKLNALHSSFGGAVGHDHLPSAAAWPTLIAGTALRLLSLTDEEDLYLLKAVKI